jgi:hypothetical protein
MKKMDIEKGKQPFQLNKKALRLPRQVESDPRAQQLLRILTTKTRLLWQGSELEVPVTALRPELAAALRNALGAGRVVQSLESAERTLAAEERGLNLVDRRSVVPRGVRVSRLMVMADDGAERFYRQVERLLLRHGPRVLAVCLEVDADTLGELVFGPGHRARLLLLDHKEAVSGALLSMADPLPAS